MTRGDRERACSREEVLPGPGSGDRPTRTRRQRTAIPLGSLQAHGSRRAVPPASARIFGARLPRRAPLTLNPSPLSSDMFSFPCDSSWLPRHHFASFSSHRTRLVERIPRLSALVPKESVIAPFIWGATGTQATRAHENRGSVWMGRLADDRGGGGGWAARGRGKLAPGSRPADTPSGTIAFAGAFGLSSWSPPYSLRRVRSHWESNGVYGKRMDPSLDPLRRTSKRVVVET